MGGGGGGGCGYGFVGSGRDETVKRFSKCLRERERVCVCVCVRVRLMKWLKTKGAKNEKGQKKQRENLGLGEGKFRTRWGQFKVLLRWVIGTPLYLSLTPLKQVYCGGSVARHYSTSQNTRTIVAGQ